MPLDLGNHPARLAPASGLIAEARMTPAHIVRGSSDRTLEQIADWLEHAVPAVGAVHVAGTQGAAFKITELVEHEQRVVQA